MHVVFITVNSIASKSSRMIYITIDIQVSDIHLSLGFSFVLEIDSRHLYRTFLEDKNGKSLRCVLVFSF